MKESMIIYESAYLAICYLPDDEMKWEAIEGLLRYGFYGEQPKSENHFINMIYVQALPSMQSAKERYEKAIENGKKGGRPTTISTEKILQMKQEGMTNKQVAENLGCSVKNIENRITSYNRSHPNNPNNLSVSVSESNSISSSMSATAVEIKEKKKEREIKDLSEQEGKEIIEKIHQRVRYTEIQKSYGLKEYITKDFPKLWEKELLARKEAIRQKEIEENKSKYVFLQKFWDLSSLDEARQRMKSFLEKYSTWTLDKVVQILQDNNGLDFQTYNTTIDKIKSYDWTSKEYKDRPSVFYIDWLNTKMCELDGC